MPYMIFAPEETRARRSVWGRAAAHLAGWVLGMCLIGHAAASEARVVVTTKPIHSLVASVMGAVASPRLLVEGAASPHTFTLKPSGARAINDAEIFIRISDAIEPFTRKIVSALPTSVTLLTLADAKGITLLGQRKGGSFEEHGHHGDDKGEAHGHKDDEGGEVKDGHIWLAPSNATAIVEAVSAALSAKFPDHATTFKANTARTVARIEAMAKEIETLVTPVKDRPFIVFHDSTQYFEHSFGLAAAGSITVSPDVQPSAKRLTAVRKKIASLGAACVFTEPGFQPNLVAAVTEGTNARSGALDAEGARLTPGPNLYFDLMGGLARSLADCLRPPA